MNVGSRWRSPSRRRGSLLRTARRRWSISASRRIGSPTWSTVRRPHAKLVGLADLLAGRATFGAVIQRDLFSNLDIISTGGDLTGVEGLDDIFAALQSAYGRVVAHASDWRAAAAHAAAARADAIVIVSPPARLEGAVHSAQAMAGESHPEILAFRARTPQAVYEDAA